MSEIKILIENLKKYSFSELKIIAENLDLKLRRKRDDLENDILEKLYKIKIYRDNKVNKYKRIKQLGNIGKDGITYLVEDDKKKNYAMKTFKKNKSEKAIIKEYEFQKLASLSNISPKPYEYDIISKYILMDIMDDSLMNIITKNNGILSKEHQQELINIFDKLDELGIFHNDSNITNYMLKNNKIYIIDYGMSKEITPKLCQTLKTNNPNKDLMTLGFILELKNVNCPSESYSILKNNLSKYITKKFNL